jgi:hypothetical protein
MNSPLPVIPQTNKPTLYYHLTAHPVYNLFFGSWISAFAEIILQNQFTFFFCNPDGSKWTSGRFHHTHLYLLLRVHQLLGDPLLKALGGGLEDNIFSFHTYRRGGLSHVSSKRHGCIRAATAAETVEHG